ARINFQNALAITSWVGEDDVHSRAMAMAFLGQYEAALDSLRLEPGKEPNDPLALYFSAQINALRYVTDGRGTSPRAAIALHDLIMNARWGDADWSDLAYSLSLKNISDDAVFKDLVTALQKPLSDPQRDLILARSSMTIADRLSANAAVATA